ncbi:MAG: hypothetical protein AAF909_15715 [Pseudomonadota bacterium]
MPAMTTALPLAKPRGLRVFSLKSLTIAAIGAAGVLALGSGAARADTGALSLSLSLNGGAAPLVKVHHGHGNYGGSCAAAAKTAINTFVPRTKFRATGGPRRACREAIYQCEKRLNIQRRQTGFGFPLARCVVLEQGKPAFKPVHKPKPIYKPKPVLQTRCVAKAFTRRGFELAGTRAAEQRPRERGACRAALRKCEVRLDRKRYADGRRYPYARCDVVRTKRVALKGRYH